VDASQAIEDTSPEEIAKGLRAAQAVLDAAGVTDAEAAWGLFELESFDDAPERNAERRVANAAFDAGVALMQARKAAIAACCQGWAHCPRSGDWTLDVLI
jgi:hypothetical protein